MKVLPPAPSKTGVLLKENAIMVFLLGILMIKVSTLPLVLVLFIGEHLICCAFSWLLSSSEASCPSVATQPLPFSVYLFLGGTMVVGDVRGSR